MLNINAALGYLYFYSCIDSPARKLPLRCPTCPSSIWVEVLYKGAKTRLEWGGTKMKFYLAAHPRDHVSTKMNKKTYLWEICRAFDGVMISRGYLSKSIENAIIEQGGYRNYFRIPQNIPTICDSGAIQWKCYKEPPISPRELLDFYVRCKFETGVSLDHYSRPGKVSGEVNGEKVSVIITDKEAERRQALTIKFARETMGLLDSKRYQKLKIYGSVQGWDIQSYLNCVREYLKIGYRRVAVGGLAFVGSTDTIREVLQTIMSEVRKFNARVKKPVESVHILGVAREVLISPFMRDLRISSFDSASWHRRAWLRGSYLFYQDGKMETYDVKEYDVEKYHKNPPIPNCNCPVCKAVGIDEKGIPCPKRFGGNQRNMSRGFHNLWHFYRYFKEVLLKRTTISDSSHT